ncbi:sugar transferase [Clostridium sp. NSJ-49]|uniref:sugar transferase n=1 Tax=Clostridium disporicum TaxID=84024 RepID=UPI00164B6551|nr:sugar transferase [Clostridium sp. NSJ-49]MBC5625940.1 sugar transferase [Clostridium sp. NSJ-49]
MSLKKYDSLPEFMKNPEVKEYYDILSERKGQLILKRLFDIVGGAIGTIVLLPIMAVLAIIIKSESEGPALFKQVRVTQYGREFKILKFRTMVVNAEKLGTQVTSKNDPRVTKVGRFLRKYRLDELPQIINILKGDLSFVGTRPEVPKFVKEYTNEMIATLLLPAGVTSEASIEFKDEEKILDNSSNVDNDYIYKVLPLKMKYNLNYIKHFTALYDFKIMLRTVGAVLGLGENRSSNSADS